MPRYWTNRLMISLLALLLASCRLATPPPSPTLVPITASPTPHPDLLSACNPQEQAHAMLPGEVPDWAALDLSACYELTLDLQAADGAFSGTARVTVPNRGAIPLPDLVFRTYPNAETIYGGSLTVTQASVDGALLSPQVFLPDGTAVRLTLPAPLLPGVSTMVEMHFRGQAPADFGNLPETYGVFNYDTAAQVLMLANAYPILAVEHDGEWQTSPVYGGGDAVVSEAALYRVQVSAPPAWHVVTSGTPIAADEQGARLNQTFVTGPVREFSLIASPHFVERQARAGDVLVSHWGLPGGEAHWEEALQATVDALTVYNQRFGPYPYRELDVAAAPMKNASGVEYPGLFLLRDGLYHNDSQRPFLLGLVVAHEAAHQWWYGVVGSDVLQSPWQDEGLTTFSSLVYQEVYQPSFYEGTLQFYENQVAAIEDFPGSSDVAQPLNAFQQRQQAYGVVVYQKGALFFNALRERLGDEVFFGALQRYYEHNRYRLAAPDDLLGAFEARCECELDEVFRSWGVED